MSPFLICTLTDYLRTLEKQFSLTGNTDKYSQEQQLLLSTDYWDKKLGGVFDYHYLSHLLQNIYQDQIILYLTIHDKQQFKIEGVLIYGMIGLNPRLEWWLNIWELKLVAKTADSEISGVGVALIRWLEKRRFIKRLILIDHSDYPGYYKHLGYQLLNPDGVVSSRRWKRRLRWLKISKKNIEGEHIYYKNKKRVKNEQT